MDNSISEEITLYRKKRKGHVNRTNEGMFWKYYPSVNMNFETGTGKVT
jgi:hypothetical protein